MTDLVAFLRARLDEREGSVEPPDFIEEDSAHGPGWGNRGPCPICDAHLWSGSEEVTEEGWWDHAERVHDAKYVLADVEAKRRIVAEFEQVQADYQTVHTPTLEGQRFGLLKAVALLAQAHADHPEYDESWRP